MEPFTIIFNILMNYIKRAPAQIFWNFQLEIAFKQPFLKRPRIMHLTVEAVGLISSRVLINVEIKLCFIIKFTLFGVVRATKPMRHSIK